MRALTAVTRGLSTLALLALLPLKTEAQNVVVHTTLDSWLAAVSGVAIDSYDDLPGAFIDSPLTRIVGPYNYRASALLGLFPAGSDTDRWLSTETADDPIVLDNFSANVRGVGGFFFGTDREGAFVATSQITVSAVSGAETRSVTLTNPGLTTFWGITSDQAITSLTVGVVQPDNAFIWPTINDLHLGAAPQVVPEPSTYLLVAAGLAMIGVVSRRRRV